MTGKSVNIFLIAFFVFATHIVAAAQDLIVYDIENNEQVISKGKTFVILKNNRSCRRCFTQLYSSIKATDSTSKIILVSDVPDEIYFRKLEYGGNKDLIPNVDEYYFSYSDSKSDKSNVSPFVKYAVEFTPGLIIITDGKSVYQSYEKIFVNHNLEF